jgi:hypothetical protein
VLESLLDHLLHFFQVEVVIAVDVETGKKIIEDPPQLDLPQRGFRLNYLSSELNAS